MSPMAKRWTLKETEFVKNNMDTMTIEELQKYLPNRSEQSIKVKITEVFTAPFMEKNKDEIIRKYTQDKVAARVLSKIYGVSEKTIGKFLRIWGVEVRTRKAGYNVISGNKNACWSGFGELSGKVFHAIERDAQRREIPFEVTIEQLWELFLKQDRRCILSGELLVLSNDNQLRTASIDRKDCQIGYVIENLQWVHKHVNIMKNRFSDEEYIKWCRLVVKNNEEKEEGDNDHPLHTCLTNHS